MAELSSNERAVVERAGAEDMLDQVLAWAAINSGSRNLAGLERMADLLVDAFAALPKKIDGITGFEYGTDVSSEGLAEGFTHCFLVTFKDGKSRDAYLPHAAHKEFVALALPKIDKVLVLDYFARK